MIKRNEAEVVKATAKSERWVKIAEDLEQDLLGTRKLTYSMAKSYRKGNSDTAYSIRNEGGTDLLVEPEEISQRWKEYFETLLNVEENENGNPEENLAIISEEERNSYNDLITMREVKEAIQSMKNSKAPGDDELPIELFKMGGD